MMISMYIYIYIYIYNNTCIYFNKINSEELSIECIQPWNDHLIGKYRKTVQTNEISDWENDIKDLKIFLENKHKVSNLSSTKHKSNKQCKSNKKKSNDKTKLYKNTEKTKKKQTTKKMRKRKRLFSQINQVDNSTTTITIINKKPKLTNHSDLTITDVHPQQDDNIISHDEINLQNQNNTGYIQDTLNQKNHNDGIQMVNINHNDDDDDIDNEENIENENSIHRFKDYCYKQVYDCAREKFFNFVPNCHQFKLPFLTMVYFALLKEDIEQQKILHIMEQIWKINNQDTISLHITKFLLTQNIQKRRRNTN